MIKGRINDFIEDHAEFFRFRTIAEVYPASPKVHPHDNLINWLFLRWFPEWITPNKLTLLRIVMTPVVFFLIFWGHYTIGVVLFLLTALTDAFDGSMARTQGKITQFGMLFDPLADKLLIGSLILLLVFQHYPIWVGIMVLILEILFIISATVAKVKFKTIRMANVWGKIKMVLQVLAVFATLLGLLSAIPQFFTVGFWLFGLAIGFAVVSLFQHGV